MHKYFEIVNLPVPCAFILEDGSRFCMQLGSIPSNSLAVFKNGFAHLGLKPEAVEILKKETEDSLLQLIKHAKRIEDLEILALVKPKNKKLQAAVEVKRAAFTVTK